MDTIKSSKVKWYLDNAAVCSIVSKGSMILHLQQIAYDIFSICVRYSIELDFEWIPRTLNDKADSFLKILDSDDWSLSSKLFDLISSRWGPFAVDWFASEHNAKVATFYTRFWCERTAGVDVDQLANLYSVILRLLVPLHYSLAYVPFKLMVNHTGL